MVWYSSMLERTDSRRIAAVSVHHQQSSRSRDAGRQLGLTYRGKYLDPEAGPVRAPALD
jgi:hypothetical protein